MSYSAAMRELTDIRDVKLHQVLNSQTREDGSTTEAHQRYLPSWEQWAMQHPNYRFAPRLPAAVPEPIVNENPAASADATNTEQVADRRVRPAGPRQPESSPLALEDAARDCVGRVLPPRPERETTPLPKNNQSQRQPRKNSLLPQKNSQPQKKKNQRASTERARLFPQLLVQLESLHRVLLCLG